MSVKRFVGANSRDAMRQVRAALGDDALILSNRQVTEGVEILALAEDDHGRMTEQASRDEPAAYAAPRRSPPSAPATGSRPAPTTGAAAMGGNDFAAFSERLLGEMQDLRALVASQQNHGTFAHGAAHGSPHGSSYDRLQQRLLAAGFSPRLARELLENLPPELMAADADSTDAWLERQLSLRLAVLDDEATLLDRGGVFALVGPTGIGKTTTTAKLAARYVMRHGAAGVALVTTDSYRIGAHEQLRIYARLLGVEVHALEADAPLGGLLENLAEKRLIIIDTVGMSQRDQRLVGQIAMLANASNEQASRPIRRLLLLNAASHGDTLEEVVETYQRASVAAGAPLFGAILTKVDEAPRLGAVLDIAIRHDLKLHYVSTGQQVPEDLRLAESDSLIERALSIQGESSFAAEVDERSHASSGRRLQALSRGLLGQGRALASSLTMLRREVSGFALLEQAWPLLGYPIEQQRSQLPGLLDVAKLVEHQRSPEAPHAMLWARSRAVSGSDWPMPALCLNPAGRAQALPWLAHRQPVGEEQRLAWAADTLRVGWQLLPQCPTGSAREVLEANASAWLATAQGNSRVIVGAERHTLSALTEQGEFCAQQTCRYRGREARLALSRLPVCLADGEALDAWFGTLNEAESGRRVLQRYWLAPRGQSELSMSEMLTAQLIHDDLTLLTRRAWQRIKEASQQPLDPELCLWVAAALSAVASRLDQERDDWAMDVRAPLLGLLGGRRSRSPSVLLEALLQLFTARDVFMLMGDGSPHRRGL